MVGLLLIWGFVGPLHRAMLSSLGVIPVTKERGNLRRLADVALHSGTEHLRYHPGMILGLGQHSLMLSISLFSIKQSQRRRVTCPRSNSQEGIETRPSPVCFPNPLGLHAPGKALGAAL